MAREMRFLFTVFLYFVEICHKVYPNERDKEFGYCYWGEIMACTLPGVISKYFYY